MISEASKRGIGQTGGTRAMDGLVCNGGGAVKWRVAQLQGGWSADGTALVLPNPGSWKGAQLLIFLLNTGKAGKGVYIIP